MSKKGNIYTNLKIDIPTVRGVMIEKYVNPIIGENVISWYDKNGFLHSFNGFASYIEINKLHRRIYLIWHNHGVYIKNIVIYPKLESEIIAKKIAARNFQERASAKKKR